MPVLDGMQTTERIRGLEEATGTHITVLALTASVMKEDRDQCIHAGMDGLIGKPIDFNELLMAIENKVPSGAGQTNNITQTNLKEELNIDFSPLDTVLDIKKGLATWRDPAVYAQALIDFATHRSEDAAAIADLFTSSPEGAKEAHRIAHGLKGLAGNLALTEVFPIASDLNDKIKTGKPKEVDHLLTTLTEALQAVSSAIALFHIPDEKNAGEQSPKVFNVEQATPRLHALMEAMDSLNPETVISAMAALNTLFDQSDLAAIQEQVDNFDFDEAKVAVSTLANTVGISLEGSGT